MSIRIVNRRNVGAVPAGAIRIYLGRPSALGNPFVIGRDGSRADVIRKYESWLLGQTEKSEPVMELERVTRLAGNGHLVELECWCSPLPCHAEVVKRIIEHQI